MPKFLYCYLSILTLSASLLQAQQLVKDINPGTLSSMPQQLLTIKNTIYFVATDPSHGQELWKTDGTQQGTVLIKDIAPGSTSSQIRDMVNLNGTLYFSAVSTLPDHQKRQLWKSDGTDAGTFELNDGHKDGEVYDVLEMTKVGSTLYYIKRSSLGGSDNWMLYRMETNSQETVAIYKFPIFDITPPKLGEANNLLYISYQNDLWKYDPQVSANSPILIKAKVSGASLASYQNILYFVGYSGSELWATQGSEASTKKIFSGKSQIITLKKAGEYLFFTAGQDGRELWMYKGETSSAQLIQTFAYSPTNITSPFSDFTIIGRTPVYFTVGQDGKLYYTLTGGVSTVSGTFSGQVQNLISLQNTLYFRASNGLYRIQGAVNKAVSVLPTQSTINYLTAQGDVLFFAANLISGLGVELYQLTPAK